MNTNEQAQHVVRLTSLLAERCAARMDYATKKAKSNGERNEKNPTMRPVETDPHKIAACAMGGYDLPKNAGISNAELYDQIKAARRELLGLQRCIERGMW